MCTILDAVEQKGIIQGKSIGENAILKLVKILLANNKMQEIEKIYDNVEYREELMRRYKIYQLNFDLQWQACVNVTEIR